MSDIFSLSLKWQEEKNYKCQIFGFPDSSVDKESACKAGNLGLIPGLGRSPGEGKGYPLQYRGLENSVDCISPWGRKESNMTKQLSLSYEERLDYFFKLLSMILICWTFKYQQ